MEDENVYKEYCRFVNKEVEVRYHEADEIKTVKGKLRFLSFSHLSCVVATKEDKIIIKNVITIKRQRNGK